MENSVVDIKSDSKQIQSDDIGDKKDNQYQHVTSTIIYNEDLPLDKMSRPQLLETIKIVLNSSVSISIGIVLTNILLSINLIFAGKLNNENILSGIGLANVMMNCCGAYMMQGLNQGFGSLAGRAVGSKSTILLHDYLFKGFLTIVFVSFAFGLFLVFQEDILIALSQDPSISYYAYVYGIGILPGLILSFFFDCLRNYLNANSIYNQPMYVQFCQAILHLIFSYICVDILEMELSGIILATNLTYASTLIAMYFLLKHLNLMPNFSLFNKDQLFKEYYSYCRYVIPIALPMVVDIFCFEINSILIGSLQNKAYFSAHVILCNIVSIFYSFPLGLGAAICTLISNAIGYNNQQRVKNLYHLSYFFGVIIGFIFLIVFGFYYRELANIYTSDTDTILNFEDIITIYRLFVIFDNLQCSMQGVLKGVGLGDSCLKMFLMCYYVIGTPVSCILAFYFSLELVGFWIGFCIAIASIFSAQVYVLTHIQWDSLLLAQFNITQQQKILAEQNNTENNNNIELPLLK